MENANPNPFPEIKLVQPIKAVFEWVGKVVRLGAEVEPCLSEHRGAAAMLDEALEPQLPFPDGSEQ